MDKRFEKLLIILMAGAFIFLFASSTLNTATGNEETLENQFPGIMRFHVIANSDSAEDQELKLKIRDYVLTRVQQELDDNRNPREYIFSNLDKIQLWSEEGLEFYGSHYKCKASIGVRHIPAKYYDDLLFPEGNYEALTITIGEGKGQNWWCVVFPPLCLVDSDDTVTMEQMDIDQGQKIVLKSKLKELLSAQPVYKSTTYFISDTLLSINKNMAQHQ